MSGMSPSTVTMWRSALILGGSLLLQAAFNLRWCYLPFILFTLYLASGGWEKMYILLMTLPRDVRFLRSGMSWSKKISCFIKEKKSYTDLAAEICAKQPNKIALISAETGDGLTFQKIDEMSNQIGHAFKRKGYHEGDCIALLAESTPEYICYWLGLAKIGVVTSLVNVNLQGDPLAHCINISNAKALLYDPVFSDVVKGVKGLVKSDLEYFCTSGDHQRQGVNDLKRLTVEAARSRPQRPKGQHTCSPMLYMYTSGTTGMPKAAVISNLRAMICGTIVPPQCDVSRDDVIYIPLPLHHGAGGMVATAMVLLTGCTGVVRKKFSANGFIDDCIKYNCTVSLYIGEICRYLLKEPKKIQDTQHKLRILYGTGLRANVWDKFQKRFKIGKVIESYGSTEGPGLSNTVGKVGAVGFIPQILPRGAFSDLIRIDVETQKVERGSDGFCIPCKPGESGEFVAPWKENEMGNDYGGFLDKDATQKRKLRNVFKEGDTYFRTGDLLYKDEFGFLYFMDRIGDTFRWKAERVSTAQVESAISKHLGFKDVIAYGVVIPETDGKACMIAIADPNKHVNIASLFPQLEKILPFYERPVFIRRTNAASVTDTFKYKKVQLKDEAFHPDKVKGDDVFVFDAGEGSYKILNDERYEAVMSGKFYFYDVKG